MLFRYVLALLLIGATGMPVSAQMATGKVVLATVVDTRGIPQVDVEADDFVITEAGEPREVIDLHVADYPIVLLLDDGRDERFGVAIRDAAKRFVERIGERPLAVGLFSNDREMLATFDDDRATVLERLTTTPLRPAPAAAILPVVGMAARLVRDTGAPFAAIVLVTAGPVDARATINSDLLPFIVETHAPLHVVALQPRGDDPENAIPDLLRGLSEQTRGQYTPIFSPASYGIALDRLADRMSTELMISYLEPEHAHEGDVRVGVKKPGAIVLGMGVGR
ncbi:MAG: hypothetical protein LBQ09_01920 [Acidobacteriaceae bacterium]|jgi:hypothetical protein|nr:hypothetical protein [Acidobacteriaceae bacterium]